MSQDVLTVGSTMRIPLLYQDEYSQWTERFMNYLKEQTDREAMINSIKNGEGVMVTSSSLEMLTNSFLGGIMVSLIFLEGLEDEA
nr:hypothetical protein [Tanacetum cinerariifolium]